MAEENKRVLVISRDVERFPRWLEILENAGWVPVQVPTRDAAVERLSDFSPFLMFLDIEPEEHVVDIDEDFDRRCREAGLAVIPILRKPEPEDVADSFRRGAVDVLMEPFSDADMELALSRAGSFNDLFRENRAYRKQLEAANRELRESLSILKMDQLAGREVQLSVLPRQALVYGDYEVVHKIVPSLYLSGDFVGYSVLLDRFLIFYMADVSGHGASSAFVTVILSFMVRQISRRHTQEVDIDALTRAPEGLLEHINRQLLAMNVDKHLTMFVGAIDTERDVLRYATAAQQPMPVLVSESGAVFIEGKGKPLGLFERGEWAVNEVVLPREFSLSIASDGLLECLPGETLREQEQALLEACGRARMEHRNICAELDIDAMTEAPDDVSLLTITRNRRGGKR
ncbi:MAG TPA: fused response regulator/phosphatase [Porticoccaceae bacterium]|nr:fused response regulator/phosphatase [Porticoccaceae bacterium]HCO61065.1 fused response regulator/phosphatase [Porticoccaceae bacterium]